MMPFYRVITIDHTQCGASDSSNFPVRFAGTYTWLKTVGNGGKVQSSSGYDIIFCTDFNNPLTSKVAFERVIWGAATGSVEIYFKIATLSHTTDSTIYIYYGDNTISTDQQNKSGTWDSNFKAVYHFGDGSTLDLNDSTSNGNNLTNINSATAGAAIFMPVGGAVALAHSSSQYLDGGNPSSLNITGDLTMEALCRAVSLPAANGAVVSKMSFSAAGYLIELNNSNSQFFSLLMNSGFNQRFCNRPSASMNKDYYTMGRFTSGGSPMNMMRVYGWDNGILNNFDSGTTYNQSTSFSTLNTTSNSFRVGHDPTSSTHWDGTIDEVRISAAVRSDDWIMATINNLFPSSFYSVGTEQTTGGGGGFTTRRTLHESGTRAGSRQTIG